MLEVFLIIVFFFLFLCISHVNCECLTYFVMFIGREAIQNVIYQRAAQCSTLVAMYVHFILIFTNNLGKISLHCKSHLVISNRKRTNIIFLMLCVNLYNYFNMPLLFLNKNTNWSVSLLINRYSLGQSRSLR